MQARCSAQIAPTTHAKLKRYAQLTNQSISAALTEVVDDWMDTIGAVRIEAIVETAHSDLRPTEKVVDIASRVAYFSSPAAS